MLAALLSYGPVWALYGGGAVFALWATWRDGSTKSTAVALLFSFFISNAVWFWGRVEDRPGVYTMLQIIVATAAWTSWVETRVEEGHWNGRKRACLFIALLACVYICVNIVFAMVYEGRTSQLRYHEITTNVLYLLECLTLAGVGIADGVKSGRFARWPVLRGHNRHAHASREGREP